MFSFKMSGMVASLAGGDLLRGELRICNKKRRSYMIRVPACMCVCVCGVGGERERE